MGHIQEPSRRHQLREHFPAGFSSAAVEAAAAAEAAAAVETAEADAEAPFMVSCREASTTATAEAAVASAVAIAAGAESSGATAAASVEHSRGGAAAASAAAAAAAAAGVGGGPCACRSAMQQQQEQQQPRWQRRSRPGMLWSQALRAVLVLVALSHCSHTPRLLPALAAATTLVVRTCQDLKNSIIAINSGFNSIVQIPAGVTINLADCAGPSGLPIITASYQLDGLLPGTVPVITGSKLWPMFVTQGSVTLTLSDVVLTNGKSLQTLDGNGGCVNLRGTSRGAFTNVVFRGCTANIGGAVFVAGGNLSLTNCLFDSNTANGNGNSEAWGGAVAMAGLSNPNRWLIATSTRFLNNDAIVTVASPNARGGAVFSVVQFLCTGCTFTGNAATSVAGQATGGSIWNSQQPTTLTDTVIQTSSAVATQGQSFGGGVLASQLTATTTSFLSCVAESFTNSYGGAIFVDNGLSGTQSRIQSCTFTGNTATGKTDASGLGGAVYYIKGSGLPLEVAFSSFTSNNARGTTAYGGAIFTNIRANVRSSNFANNTATAVGQSGSTSVGLGHGGAVYSGISDAGQVFNLTSCSFTFNAASGPISARGGAVYVETNLVETGCVFTGNSVRLTVPVGVQGTTPNIALGGAVGIWNNGAYLTTFGSSYQRNSATSVTGDAAGGAIGLLGAARINNTLFVSNSATSLCSVACTTLTTVNLGGGGGAVYVTIGLIVGNSTFRFNSHTSAAPGAAVGGAISSTVLYSSVLDFAVESCLFDNNVATSTSTARGGAIVVKNVSPARAMVNNCQFTNNAATSSGADSSGGAVSCVYGSLGLTTSTFTNNSATATSGDALGGAVDTRLALASILVVSCTFTANSAISTQGNARGGGLYYGFATGSYYPLNLAQSAFISNSARASQAATGGAVYVGLGGYYQSSIVSACSFDNSTVVGSQGAGGGIYFEQRTINSFCRVSSFGRTSINTRSLAGAGQAGVLSDVEAGTFAIVKFCPQVSISVNSASTFSPILACDMCSCDRYANPCDPRATCAMQPIGASSTTIVSCTCPIGAKGNGFVCGNILVCNG